MIRFSVPVQRIHDTRIVVLPSDASSQFSSRGMVMAKGLVNGKTFQAPLEPDGRGSHWFALDDSFSDHSPVRVEIEPTKEWHEPSIPKDVQTAIKNDIDAQKLWSEITPMARWDWLRWIRATNNQETRSKRIRVMLSKLNHGERRPCCFNRTMCTDPTVSKSGLLLVENA